MMIAQHVTFFKWHESFSKQRETNLFISLCCLRDIIFIGKLFLGWRCLWKTCIVNLNTVWLY